MHVCRHMSLLSNTGQLLKRVHCTFPACYFLATRVFSPWQGPTWAHCTCEQCPQCFPPFLVLTSTSLQFPPRSIWQISSSKTPPSSLFHVLLSDQCDLYDVVNPVPLNSKKNIKDWMKLVETGALLISRTGPLRQIKTQSLGTPGKTGEAFNPIRVLRIWVFSTVHRPLGLFRIAAKKGMSGQWQRTKAHLEKLKANAYKDYIL